MEPLLCKKCGSKVKTLDLRKRGVFSIIAGFLMFPFQLLIGSDIFAGLFFFLLLFLVGIYFLCKKERYVFWCKHCVTKTDESGVALP